MNRQLSKAQKNLEKMMGKKNLRMASNITAVVLVLVAVLLVPHLQLNALSWLDNAVARGVLMVVIVLVCLFDPIVALLLAILFVVALQRLHKLKKAKNAEVVLNALNTIVNNNAAQQPEAAPAPEPAPEPEVQEEIVDDELPQVEVQEQVLPPNNNDNSQVVLSEVNPANMKEDVNYNLTPDVIDNVLQVDVVGAQNSDIDMYTVEATNSNVVGNFLEEGSEDVLNANGTEHFLSVENAHGVQNNVLTARIVCKQTGFENDAELVAKQNNTVRCKPFTNDAQFLDAQSNLVNCKENRNMLATQGHGSLRNVPRGSCL
jgi:type II secretory pathway pseudopilin PulG